MSKRSIGILGVVAIVVAAALWFTASTPGQGSSSGAVARTEDGKPNINGIWQSLTTANWDIEAHSAEAGPRPEIMGAYGAQPGGMSIIVDGDGTIPYKPEAVARKEQNFQNRMTPKVTNEQAAACNTAVGQGAYAALGLPFLDGSLETCEWASPLFGGPDADAVDPKTFGPSSMPSLHRPDYVTNSNDSYWLSNP